jgi:hypothetical protein
MIPGTGSLKHWRLSFGVGADYYHTSFCKSMYIRALIVYSNTTHSHGVFRQLSTTCIKMVHHARSFDVIPVGWAWGKCKNSHVDQGLGCTWTSGGDSSLLRRVQPKVRQRYFGRTLLSPFAQTQSEYLHGFVVAYSSSNTATELYTTSK